MKKTLLTTLFVATATFAGAADNALTGLHLGVQGNFQRMDLDQRMDTLRLAAGTTTTGTSKVKKPFYGFSGDIFLAYYKNCDGMHLGAKLAVGKGFSKREKNTADSLPTAANAANNVKAKVSQDYSVSLTGEVGTYVSKDTAVYGILGLKRTRFDMSLRGNDATAGATAFDSSVGKTLWGTVLGFGMKKAVSDAWLLNADVTYEIYKTAKTGNMSKSTSRQAGMRIKPRVLNVTIGLSHKF